MKRLLPLTVMPMLMLGACALNAPELELHGAIPPPSDQKAFESAIFQASGARFSDGNGWKLVPDGSIFDRLVDEIGHARRSVSLESYIWHSGEPSDRILAALQKRDPAVACRVVVDPLGSPDFTRNVQPRLEAMRCEAHVFRPLSKHLDAERDHRKIAVVDGSVGFVGGFGIRKEWAKASGSGDPEWRDINLRVTGPVVAEMQRAFAQDWMQAGGALLPPSEFSPAAAEGGTRAAFVTSSYSLVTNAERLTLLTLAAAKKRLWIWNAYFVPDGQLEKLLLEKRHAGVDVRVLAPGDKNDVLLSKLGQRATYKTLRGGGVRIFEFRPTMMHAKAMIVDDELAVIGSINLSALSLTRLQEDALVALDHSLVEALEAEWKRDMEKAREVP
jgi:cardiolipin synthase A/B